MDAVEIAKYNDKFVDASIFDRCSARGFVYNGNFYEMQQDHSNGSNSFNFKKLDCLSIIGLTPFFSATNKQREIVENFVSWI